MIDGSIFFDYLEYNFTKETIEKRINYLKIIENDFKSNFFPDLVVFVRKREGNPTGLISLYATEDSKNIRNVCDYLLSNDRKYIPVGVSCADKKDFGLVREILGENYGDKGRLTLGFLGIPALFGQRKIKVK